jgi:hypothetical protein
MVTKIIYGIALTITILATLNFVWMAVAPGPKENLFKALQIRFNLSRNTMNGVYFFIGFSALLTAAMSISYVVKAEECGDDF